MPLAYLGLEMACDYLSTFYPDGQLELQFARMQCSAQNLVRSSRREIEVIAAPLLRRGTLTAAEITELLDERVLPRWRRTD